MEAQAGGSSIPLYGHHWPQKSGISPKYQEVKPQTGSLGPLLHPVPVFQWCIDLKIRMSRWIPSRVFMPPTNPPHLNPCSLQLSLWAPSGGPWRNRSASPLSPNLLSWEAQRAKPMCPPPWGLPFWAPCMLPPGSGHPGSQYTLSLLQALYW